MKKIKSTAAVFLSIVLVVSAVLGQISLAVHADAAGIKDAKAGSSVRGPQTDDSGITTWDCIYFGKYWQNDTDGNGTADESDEKERIKWRVLSVEGNDAFLMADQCLDYMSYQETEEGEDEEASVDQVQTWEVSSLRTWLNGAFCESAFTQEEQDVIRTTTVKNDDTEWDGGKATQDKVYLLSLTEATASIYGFPADVNGESEPGIAEGTSYALSKSPLQSQGPQMNWWLRSAVYSEWFAAVVNTSGEVEDQWGAYKNISKGVRPVLHMDLSDLSVWESAGTVTAAQPAVPTEKPKEDTPAPTSTPSARPTRTPYTWPVRTPAVRPTRRPTATPKPTATTVPKATPVPKKPVPATRMRPGEKRAISSFKDLQAMEDIPSGNYYLAKDITVPKNARIFCDYPFTGTLDGRGHKIKGYQASQTVVSGPLQKDNKFNEPENTSWEASETWFGIFDQASGATFKNISLTKVKIDVRTDCMASVGALVRDAGSCTFDNIHVSGRISVTSTRENPFGWPFLIGGIAAGGTGKMVNCSNSAAITADCMNSYNGGGVYVGGLSGRFNYSLLKNCTNSGNLSLSGYSGWDLNGGSRFGVAGLTMGEPLNKKTRKTTLLSCTNSGSITLQPSSKGKKYYDTSIYGLTDLHEEIWCSDLYAVGLVADAGNVKYCGNTGKIKAFNPMARGKMYVAGLGGQTTGNLSRCCNKGSISFNGYLKLKGNVVNIGGLFGDASAGENKVTTECYNTGKINVRIKNKEKVKTHHQLLECYSIGGILGQIHTMRNKKIANCYNTGNIRVNCDGPWQAVGGIAGKFSVWGGYARYNYNVGTVNMKHVSKVDKKKGSAVFGVVGEARMAKSRLAQDNYYTRSSVPYASHEAVIKKWVPAAKKVSSVTRAKCPKLSSKYWVYSPKVKRLVLKNNNETRSVKKVTGKRKKL